MIAYDIFSYSDTGWFMNALSFFNSTDNKIMVTIVLVAALIVIIELVALWGIFTKAKKPGFISLIPIYNIISLLNLAKLKAYHFILLCIPVVGLYSWYRLSMNLAQVFKKKPSFGWGLFFLNPIFTIILGFGDSEYDRNYYYTEVEETPTVKEVIAPNRMVFEDYNQGLIFDPAQNVDDVVTAAPMTNDTNEMFESDMNKEGISMAFQDMSEAAMNNANGVGGVPELGTPQMDTGMIAPTPEPPRSYSATPNQFFMPEASQDVNVSPVAPAQMESTETESKFGAEPAKMTVEQLLGLQPTTGPNAPKAPVEQSNINADNVFGVQLQAEPVAPAPVTQPTSDFSISQPAPDLMAQQQMPPQMDQSSQVMAPPEVPGQSFSADAIMNVPLDTTMPAPAVALANTPSQSMPSQDESVSQDINQILGINPNDLQAVPLEQPSAVVPEVPASQPTPTTQPQNDVSSADFNDDISKILGINPAELEAVPLTPDAPVVPEINMTESNSMPQPQTSQTTPATISAPVETGAPIENVTLMTPSSTSTVTKPNETVPQQPILSQDISVKPESSSPNAPTDIDINSLLGLDNTTSSAVDTSQNSVQNPVSQTTREVTNIVDTTQAMINNAAAAAETIPATAPTPDGFNLDNFLSNNQMDAEPNIQQTNVPVGQIQSFVGQPEPLDSLQPQAPTENSFVAPVETVVTDNSKKCPNCGAKLPPEAKFCYLCGKPL